MLIDLQFLFVVAQIISKIDFLKLLHDSLQILLDVPADVADLLHVFAQVVVLDVGDLRVLSAFFDEVVDVVVPHLLQECTQVRVEGPSQLNLLLIAVFDHGQPGHILQMLVLHLRQLSQEFEDELVHLIALILRVQRQLPVQVRIHLTHQLVVCLTHCGQLYPSNLEALTSQLGSTLVAVWKALILNVDVKLGSFIQVIGADGS